jgi:hypothetical protein
MANEVTNTISFSVTKNSVTISGGTTKQSDMGGNAMASEVFGVSNAPESITALMPDISSYGNIYIRNIDASNTLLVFGSNGGSTTGPWLQNWILPGDQVLLSPHMTNASGLYVAFCTNTSGHAHIAAFARS